MALRGLKEPTRSHLSTTEAGISKQVTGTKFILCPEKVPGPWRGNLHSLPHFLTFFPWADRMGSWHTAEPSTYSTEALLQTRDSRVPSGLRGSCLLERRTSPGHELLTCDVLWTFTPSSDPWTGWIISSHVEVSPTVSLRGAIAHEISKVEVRPQNP